MLKFEQVPDEVAWKLHNKLWGSGQFSVEEGRAAIAAAINAWPGAFTVLKTSDDKIEYDDRDEGYECIALPLTETK